MRKYFLLFTFVLLSHYISFAQTPYVVWCSDNTTLYFTYRTEVLTVNGSFVPEGESEARTISALWSGTQVTESPESPGWSNYTGYSCTKAVIESNFVNVKPHSMSRWFWGCSWNGSIASKLTTIEGFTNLNTEDVTTMDRMFYGCKMLGNLDFSHFNTSNVTGMYSMFYECRAMTTLDLSSFNTENVTTMQAMFDNCQALQSIDVSHFNTGNCTTMKNMFRGCGKIKEIDLRSFDTENVVDMEAMFQDNDSLKHVYLTSFNTSSVQNMSNMFYNCRNLTEVDLSSFNTSNVTNMSRMFDDCYKLSSLNLSNFDTSSVQDMSALFAGCQNLTEVNISSFNTSNVTNMRSMFFDCESLTSLDLSHFDTSSVQDMSDLFCNCYNLTDLNISSFNTSNVTSMKQMFLDCRGLTSLNLSHFDTSSVQDMSQMFYECRNLTEINLSSFNTSNVTDMYEMFDQCRSLTTLDLSSFNTSKVTNMNYMFGSCVNLQTIIVSELWSVNKVTSGNYMFSGSISLVGGSGTVFDNTKTTHEYAHIDAQELGYPGYFTASNTTSSSQPDLRAHKIEADRQTIIPGESLQVSWVTANFGEQPTTGGWSEQVLLVSESGSVVRELALLNYDDVLAGNSFVNHQVEVDLPFLLGIDGTAKIQVKIIPNESTGEPENLQGNNTQTSDLAYTVKFLLRYEIVPSRVKEGVDTEVQAILTHSGDSTQRQYIYLVSPNDSRVGTQSFKWIPAGQSELVMNLGIRDNTVVDADSVVIFKARRRSVDPHTEAQLIIVDDEMPKLDVTTSKSELSEGETFELTVTADHAPSAATSLMLTCDNSARFDFPSQLTLPAGETTVSTTITVVDDHDIAETLSAAFTASANGYESGEAIVIVNDDDMPHIELDLFPTKVVANAGANAIMGIIRRTDNLNSKISIVLSDDAEGLLTYSSQQITLESGVAEAHFTISRNGTVTTDREVNVTAAVYIKTCNCPAAVQSGGSTTRQLTLLAADGPALVVEPLTTDFSAESNSNGIVVKIESPAQEAIEVYVSSDLDDDLEYEHIVTIPAGETSVTVPVIRKNEAEIPEGQVIVFTASADGYSSSACWTIATENSMPDAVITSFEVSTAEAEAGSEVELTIVVKNAGSGPLGENTSIKVTLSDGSYPIVLKTGAALSSGESTTITASYQLPLLTGDYTFLATVNPAGKVDEVVTTNNKSLEIPITITPNYHLTALVDKTSYGQGEVITVTGKATGSGSAFADVEVYFINDDMRQTVTAKTDAEGNYSAVFLPLDGTSGHFVIGACFPGEDKSDAMAEVDVYGLKLQNYRTKCQLGQGGSYNGVITVTNPGQESQTVLHVVQQDTPVGCEFSFTNLEVIEAGQTLDIPYTITAVGNDGTTGVKRMNVSVTTSEGALAEYAIDYSIEPVRGCLKTDSASITMNMTLGVAREFPLTIWNGGLAPSGAISLTLPDWIQSVTPQQMPSLASGDSVTVILRIVPNDNMYLNIPNSGRIGMNCADGTGLSIPIEVTPVSDQNGTFTIDVIDEFAFCTEEKPHVSGATVQVINRATQAVVAEGVTNAEGKFTADIPEGWYRLKVTADYHETYDEYLLVDPGANKTKTVFISFNGITMEWKVEETEVEDEYTMETIVKYESQVPPPYIDVIWPKEKPQVGKYYPVTIVNRGLIKFYDVKANIGISSSKYDLEIVGNSEIDTLEAGQAVVLYTKLTLKSNPNLSRMGRFMVGNNPDPQEPSEDPASGGGECSEFTAVIASCYDCGGPVVKRYSYAKRLGECVESKPYSSGSGTGGGFTGSEIPGEPEEFACDIPRFRLTPVNSNNTVLGVATDGVSQVRVMLDGNYNINNIVNNSISWEIDGYTNHGELVENADKLEGVVYTAPDYFPGGSQTSYKVKLNVTFTIEGEQYPTTIYNAAEIELIRVPVLLVHGLNSSPNCWLTTSSLGARGLYNYFVGIEPQPFMNIDYTDHYYKHFGVEIVDYEKSNKNQFSENVSKIGKHLINLKKNVSKNKYVADKVDVVAHSMGGLLTRLYIKNSVAKNNINKIITINTPHGGSQLGNFMTDPKIKFINKIEHDTHSINPNDWGPNPIVVDFIKILYNKFYPTDAKGKPIENMDIGAVADLSVNKNPINTINTQNVIDGVKCHAIVTSGIGNPFAVTAETGLLQIVYNFIHSELGYENVDNFIKDIFGEEKNPGEYVDWENDMIVSAVSQSGGLSTDYITWLPNNHPGGIAFTHTETCKNPVIQKRVLDLLDSDGKPASGFSNGFGFTGNLDYTLDKMTWEQILTEFPYDKINNNEELYDLFWKNEPTTFYNWKYGLLSNANSRLAMKRNPESASSLVLTHELIEENTSMKIKITPDGEFSKISFVCLYQDFPFAYEKSTEQIVRLPDKANGDIVVICQGQREDGTWCAIADTIPINTIGNTTMQKLSFSQDSLLIINDEYISPRVLCTWSDGTVTEVENPTLSVTNGNLAYIEDNQYVYGKNTGHTKLVARYGNLSCSTPLEVYFSDNDDEVGDGNNSGSDQESTCSTVTLSFKQKSVMTRQAFRGTLTINNNHPSMPLENLRLHVEVRDEDGTLATQHEFQINAESLNGDFEGELDFDSGWNLRSGGTGVATVLFIPTRNAAPTEPKKWSFGGTISYTDPFTGLVVNYPLNPVTLTVNPTPILDFTYFMQRDVMGDDPMTENTTEECIPAEFALLINNKGNADAKNLKFVCKQPQIIENEKGLLVDFSIESAQLNGENKVLTLSNDIPMEVGTVASQSQVYMQWWLKSSLLGHFNEYDVTFNHKTSYGNEELSLIDQVSIHELIHGFTPPSALNVQPSTTSRAFLVNDTEDSNDTPDRIYFTNATQEEVTVASAATISRQAGTEYLLNVTPTQEGWTYVLLDNPLSDKATVARITRQSDGADLPVDNLWLTDRTLHDGEVAQIDKKLHFIGEVPEGGEQYLVVFDFKPDRQLKVDTYEGVPAKNVALDQALTELTVCFNKPITEETFTADDLTLFHEGTMVDLSAVTISKVDAQTFTLSLGTTTSQDGYYVLLVNTQGIDDSDGFEGTVSKEASWTQDTSTTDNVVQGDVNGDGLVDLEDAKSIMNYLMGTGLSRFMMKVADANENGVIDIGDAVTIINLVNGNN